MSDKNDGLTIEGFVQRAYNRMFANTIEVRHHPLTAWAQATVSGSDTNFAETRANVLTVLGGIQHALHKANVEGNVEVLNDLGDFEARLREAENVQELGETIREADSLLDRALKPTQV